MIRFGLQALLVIAISIGALLVIGLKIYAVITVAATITSLGLILGALGLPHNNAEHAPGPVWIGYTIGLSILLGVFWPVLPIAFAWGRSRHEASTANAVVVDDPIVHAPAGTDEPKDG